MFRVAEGSRFRAISSQLRRLSSSVGSNQDYDYDLIVIGGGSGGLACSKEAASLGKRVAVLDYVAPSPQGTTWGLGGTCVNVGCIPKKLMHQASLLGQAVKDSRSYGWSVPEASHSWSAMTAAIMNHIKSLNWGHRVQLKQKNVDYFNAKGSFIDPHTVEATSQDGKKVQLRGRYVVLAVGGRPMYPKNVPGANELGITSDDVFFLQRPPGKTLVVGASYVALECAGFLAGLGFHTGLMIRSSPLKSFDQELASLVVSHMEHHGVRVMRQCEPCAVEKVDNGRLMVTWNERDQHNSIQEEWDTVLFATGREARTYGLGLDQAKVEVDNTSGKINVDSSDVTSAGHIFAIGDAVNGRWELTPVAIKAGKLLAKRLFGGSTQLMNYDMVPTTVFTPLEFAAVGLTEERACQMYGNERIEVYHAFYKPLEFYLPDRDASQCYVKMICNKEADGTERVIGLHLTGPNAGEVLQGFAVAMEGGLSRSTLESAIGIHPTMAEEVVKLHITKRSGEDPNVSAC